LKDKIISSFSNNLRELVDDIIIKDKKIFVTLKAENSNQAKEFEKLKEECEKKIRDFSLFDEINVTFTTIKRKFSKVIVVSSCKGGVGKSTLSVNLALSLKKLGKKVGLLDGDIYGPSIPKLLNINKKPDVNDKKKIIPFKQNGIEVMSIGFLIDEKKPLVWRGPMLQSAIMQLINDVEWDFHDYLIIDFPPGTGDTQLTIMQKLKIDYALIVTTPQEIALADTRKGINMFNRFNVPIAGIVENMSYFVCDNCSTKHFLFGENGGEKLAKEFNIKLLGKIPFHSTIAKNCDAGTPELIHNHSDLNKMYLELSKSLINK
jgi:ATP-binding protein involved in chromosome partitioning